MTAILTLLATTGASVSMIGENYGPHTVIDSNEPELEQEDNSFSIDLDRVTDALEPTYSVFETHTAISTNFVDKPSIATLETPAPPKTSNCPPGMLLISGQHCPTLAHQCRSYINVQRDRCKQYVPSSQCFGNPEPKRFCIDEFEYPNNEGEKPSVGMNFREANTLCESERKRLCTSSEWELACEGPGQLPYPYGYTRNDESCNIDRPYIVPNNDALANSTTRDLELARVDQREPSGNRDGCVSSFGVHDMTGNVDEWVVNERGQKDKPPYRSGLKGGYWGPVRNRCRPMTVDHNEWHNGYQVGFRCCAEAI